MFFKDLQHDFTIRRLSCWVVPSATISLPSKKINKILLRAILKKSSSWQVSFPARLDFWLTFLDSTDKASVLYYSD